MKPVMASCIRTQFRAAAKKNPAGNYCSMHEMQGYSLDFNWAVLLASVVDYRLLHALHKGSVEFSLQGLWQPLGITCFVSNRISCLEII